ncbi:HlyD family type I secretion periplasmic adaptor subunit [Thiorhodovibrio frisius]|uniref:Membrane fusion protein (MFP) family protein n=1 Tax=Thiorhodovibrio frisius TaxID=631362 RepID=H8YYA3_9GAMM|nr:HlyD family type I secretion periplasmic adaptor subunit [Thiorhodovibrio frisius]EIC23429.1 type I secretion membrane fusion protein, HlyD family [Thiorhodovibrio frisius]WPL23489.1 Type I secretion system membrane fusion protein PrsE [Thiorhodovibrio frisius]
MNKGTDIAKKQAASDKAQRSGRERRLLSETVRIEEELVPEFFRPVLYVISAVVVVFLLWAGTTHLSEVAIAPGRIIPAGKIKTVQHLDGGVVDSINVEERQRVKAGEVLLQIDGSQAEADMLQMRARLVALRLKAERLQAFMNQTEPDFSAYAESYPGLVADQRAIFLNQTATRDSTLEILKRQVEQRERRIDQLKDALATAKEHQKLTGELVAMREDLGNRKLVDRTTVLETRRAQVTAIGEVARLTEEIDLVLQELAETETRLLDTANQLKRDAASELGNVRAEIAEVQETLQRLDARVERLDVVAPIHGNVLELKVQTIGQVIQPGEILMQIVPDDVPLEAEVRIQPRDIGYVKPGLDVNLRVSAYDFSRYGFAHGALKRVSASSVVAEDGQSYFLGWVTLDKPYVGEDPEKNPLRVGMAVDGEIITGKKTLLGYLAKPVVNGMSRAFRER